ncbi:MAG: TRAP transporter substrate-binding protein DctP [Variibacter sp.]
MRARVAGKLFVMALAGVCLAANTAASEDTIVIKFAQAVPPSHHVAVHGAKPFMDRVTELSKGRIKFEWYPAQQLGKAQDMLTLVQSGVTDMADIVPSYTPDKLPLTGIAELPNQSQSSCEGTKVFQALTRPGAFLARSEYDKQKVRVLMGASYVPYKLMTGSKAVANLHDLVGLKIRSSGGAMDSVPRALGASSVRMSGPELHEAITRGTVDGALYPFISAKSFDLIGPLKNVTVGVNLGTLTTAFVISDAAWKKLPPDLQKILVQAGDEAAQQLCSYMDRSERETREEFAKAYHVIELDSTEGARWQKLLEPIAAEWSKRVAGRGRPANDALAAWAAARKP